MTTSNQKLLNTFEAAAYCGQAVSTWRTNRSQGWGPPFLRPGRGNRSPAFYRIEDLDTWLASRTFQSTADESEKKRIAEEK